MLDFQCDYLEGAHPKIIDCLVRTNLDKTNTYGFDEYSNRAKEKIKAVCECSQAEVFFLSGGTQANATVIDALLRPWHSVIAAATAHIATHEAGAIESSGHKITCLEQHDGKICAEELTHTLEEFYEDPTHIYMTQPGMVYISHPTEYGTLYTKQELEVLRGICDTYSLKLFMDGARLGYGITTPGTDVDIPTIARVCDAFTIGGTKVGALLGEAVVITREELIEGFFTTMRQHGAVMAKGRLLGIQFDTLFTDDLYLECGRHANDMAEFIRSALIEKGYSLYVDSPANQLFIVMDDEKLVEFGKKVVYSFWEKPNAHQTVIRIATSWATRKDEVDELISLL